MDFSLQTYQYLLIKKLHTLIDDLCIYNYHSQSKQYCLQKQLVLKDHIHVYTDETQTREIMNIQQKHSNSSSTVFEVIDNKEMARIGVLRSKNNSILNFDEWEIYDAQDNSLGILSEISHTLALLRQYIPDYHPIVNCILTIANHIVATYQQTFNPFCYELIVYLQSGKYQKFGRRLGIVIAIVLAFQS
jgi:hypothetical protein